MIRPIISLLGIVSRHGRIGLAAGLVAGLLLPGVANAMKPSLPFLVAVLLFLVALRIGPNRARDGLSDLLSTLGLVLLLQLVLPVLVIAGAYVFGIASSPYILAIALVLAAPSVSGSPNFAIILGADPEPAFRLMVVGTALLPLTMLPVLWLLPRFDAVTVILGPALRALAAISIAMGLGFWVRATYLHAPTPPQSDAMDGAMTVALAVIVIGLMAALRPAMAQSLGMVAGWLLLAFIINFGMQMVCYVCFRRVLRPRDHVPVSIVAGNRNIAIFLVALSPATAEPLLIFLGSYQIPMYLTPLLMARLYRKRRI